MAKAFAMFASHFSRVHHATTDKSRLTATRSFRPCSLLRRCSSSSLCCSCCARSWSPWQHTPPQSTLMHTGQSVGEHTRYTQHTATGPFTSRCTQHTAIRSFIPCYTQQLGPLLQATHNRLQLGLLLPCSLSTLRPVYKKHYLSKVKSIHKMN